MTGFVIVESGCPLQGVCAVRNFTMLGHVVSKGLGKVKTEV